MERLWLILLKKNMQYNVIHSLGQNDKLVTLRTNPRSRRTLSYQFDLFYIGVIVFKLNAIRRLSRVNKVFNMICSNRHTT